MSSPEYWGHAVIGKNAGTGVSSCTPMALAPAEAWSRFAHLLAGRKRMRLAETRTRRIEYPRRREMPLSPTAPSKPAAVHVYDERGFTRMIPLDLDAHDRTAEQTSAVDADAEQLRALLDECGCTYLSDQAHGGRHLYVLLEEPASADDARTVVTALARRFATLDPSPVYSADSGLITVPGSAHARGGHRQLTTDEVTARRIEAGLRTPAGALRRLRTALAPEVRQLLDEDRHRGEAQREARRAAGAHRTFDAQEQLVVSQRFTGRVMSSRLAQLARDGDWRALEYPSPSEARAAVLMSAIAVGMTETDIRARMLDGTFPGLRSLFSHKGLHRLRDEYDRAITELHRRETRDPRRRSDDADGSDTSPRTHTGAGGRAITDASIDPHGFIRCWRTLVHQHSPTQYPGSPGWKYQLVLRALAMNAHMRGVIETASGIRWIAVATGYSEETVALTLRELAGELDPWIVQTKRAQGVLANEYRLRIPDRHRDSAERIRWVRGKAQAIRPVFTVLGTPSALAYEAVEQGRASSYRELIERTGLGRDAAREAVSILASWGLIRGDSAGGWHLTSTEEELERLAERLGAIAVRAGRIARHRKERQRWREKLEEFELLRSSRRPPATRFLRDLEDMPADVEEMLDWMRQEAAG